MSCILSICIPTYNRASCLFECLTSILDAITGYESLIEIVISDNASTDNTNEVVKLFTNSSKLIHYHRNLDNIGGENNFRLVASLATGKYIWVFGDDDKMEKNVIQIVLSNLANDPSLIICNYSVWTRDFTQELKSNGLMKLTDGVITDKNHLLASFNVNLGYITSIVVKKDLFLDLNSNDYERYNEYGFSFMNAVYVGFAREGSSAVVISKNIIRNRSDNVTINNFYKYFGGAALIFDNLLKCGYSKSAVSRAKHQTLRNFVLPNALQLCLKPNYDRFQGLYWMFTYYRKYLEFWIIFLPIWSMPTFLIKGLKNAWILKNRFKHNHIAK
jgi:glycosyltransferase involved in cell wall biosynthesis